MTRLSLTLALFATVLAPSIALAELIQGVYKCDKLDLGKKSFKYHSVIVSENHHVTVVGAQPNYTICHVLPPGNGFGSLKLILGADCRRPEVSLICDWDTIETK